MSKFEIHPAIKEAIRHNSLILFIGSGYSRNINLPDWKELVKTMVDELSEKDKSVESLKSELSEKKMEPIKILNRLFELGYNTDCKKILQSVINIDLVKKNLENQKKIWKISEKVVTTNYDKALEGAMDEELADKVDVLVSEENRSKISFTKYTSYLYKIHGTIDDPKTCVLFTDDYDQLYKYNHSFLTEMKRLSAGSVILFIGYSIGDIEIQQILRNINSLFHIETKHFILTKDVKDFKEIGIDTIKIKEDYSDLQPYLDELVLYRQQIEKNYSEDESFIRQEDRKDILELELLKRDFDANQSIINDLKAKGKEELLKDYLLVKREAYRWDHLAYFEHIETGKGDSYYKSWIKFNLEAMEMSRQLFGELSHETINLHNDIGRGYMHLYDMENAEKYFQEGLQLALKAGDNKFLTGNFYTNLGNVETEKKDLEKALNYFKQAVKIKQGNGDGVETEMENIARTLLIQKEYKEAQKIYKQILQNNKAPNLYKAYNYEALGIAHRGLNEHEEAIKCYEEALALFFEYYGKENKEFILFYNDIGYSFAQVKQYEKAIGYYKKVLALEQNTENIFITMNNLGEAHYNAGHFEEAKAAFENSFAFLKQKGPSESEYPEAYESCKEHIKLCVDKMEHSENG